jgi:hypothetical protein
MSPCGHYRAAVDPTAEDVVHSGERRRNIPLGHHEAVFPVPDQFVDARGVCDNTNTATGQSLLDDIRQTFVVLPRHEQEDLGRGKLFGELVLWYMSKKGDRSLYAEGPA